MPSGALMQNRFPRHLLVLFACLSCAACSTPAGITPAPQPAPARSEVESTTETAGTPVAGKSDSGEPAAAPAPNKWAEPARQVLLPHCGRCHNGALETSLARAKAVYDLSETAWYARIAPHQYDKMLQRVRGVEAIPEADKSMVERFVGCARDNDCTD
ncbi:MAG: hypothetical protein A3H91_14575 [Gammaproteobacteria bacterium RIFCSPLOWO2_02_FULL_61_13]|nr:MAG: hypothetical protein A3H91_14575 [Gammaproteobacteria bacterium RIFCSPLOWO2_02_FULL_61_13]